MKTQEAKPKVSVCVVTYNQEKYISQCLQSIVDQKTDFDFEIIVSDDFSTDDTRKIVIQFAKKYPNLFKLHLHEANMGAYKNFIYVHKQPIGQYVAHIDGDDYIFPGKLQAQKQVLDAELNCNIVWHRMKILDELTGTLHNDILNLQKFKTRELKRSDLLELGTIACHSSKMYRVNSNIKLKNNFDILDYYTDIIQVSDGYAIIIDKLFGVYRFGIGIAANSSKTKKLYLNHIKEFYQQYPEHRNQIGANIFWMFLVELKNARITAIPVFFLWLKCCSYESIILVFKKISLRKTLRTKVW